MECMFNDAELCSMTRHACAWPPRVRRAPASHAQPAARDCTVPTPCLRNQHTVIAHLCSYTCPSSLMDSRTGADRRTDGETGVDMCAHAHRRDCMAARSHPRRAAGRLEVVEPLLESPEVLASREACPRAGAGAVRGRSPLRPPSPSARQVSPGTAEPPTLTPWTRGT